MERTFAIATTIAIMLAIDFTWLTLQQPMYASLVRSVQGRQISIHFASAIASYAFVVLGFAGLVVPEIKVTTASTSAFQKGALVGLVVYGVFNATNAAIFDGYKVKAGVVDTLWGTFLFAISGALFANLLRL